MPSRASTPDECHARGVGVMISIASTVGWNFHLKTTPVILTLKPLSSLYFGYDFVWVVICLVMEKVLVGLARSRSQIVIKKLKKNSYTIKDILKQNLGKLDEKLGCFMKNADILKQYLIKMKEKCGCKTGKLYETCYILKQYLLKWMRNGTEKLASFLKNADVLKQYLSK